MRRFVLAAIVLAAIVLVALGTALIPGIAPLAVSQVATPVAGSADCPATTPEENKDLVRRFIEAVYIGRDPSRVDEFLADDFNRTNPARPHSNEPGTADDAARMERSFAEFPDLDNTVEEIIAEGEKVMVLMRINGTHQGDFGDLGVPATGRNAEWLSVMI